MSKTLSQWEIDALLTSLGSEESPSASGTAAVASDRTVKLYDFRRPDKFSKPNRGVS